MPVAQQFGIEAGASPITAGRNRRRAQQPTCFRSRRGGQGSVAQRKSGYAMFCRRKGQPAACHQVEGFCPAPEFDHHCAKPMAIQSFGARTQSCHCIGDFHDQQARRIKTKSEQARAENLAPFQCWKILLHPEQPFAFPDKPRGERQYKTRGSGRIRRCGRKNFVQRAAVQTAIEAAVRPRMAQAPNITR
jgi:hypothetical protein